MSNWLAFQNEAYALTEQDVNEISKEIVTIYKASIKDINDQISEQYLRYLSSVGSADYYNEMLKYNRLTNLLQDVQASYRMYSLKAQSMVEHALSIAASNSYYRSVYASGWLTGGTFSTLPYELVELIVYGTSAEWKAIPKSIIERYGSLADYQSKAGTLSEFILKNRAEELRQIQNTITTGLQQGLSYPQMASSIKDVIGKVTYTDGTLTASGAMSNAMRIIATETTRAMNAASYAASCDLVDQGVDVKRMWMATLDSRTRSSHARLDGKSPDSEGYFHIGGDKALYPGGFSSVSHNIRCRCTTVDIIDNESPQLRTGRNPTTGEHETFNYQDFDKWASENGLTKNKYGEIFAKS